MESTAHNGNKHPDKATNEAKNHKSGQATVNTAPAAMQNKTTCAHCNEQSHNNPQTSEPSEPSVPSEKCPHVGYVHDKKKLVTRLRRIEGQVRAITAMVENDTYCIDILTQIAASNSALKSVALLLLDDHLNSCVATAAAKGGPVADEKMDEAIAAITRLVKS